MELTLNVYAKGGRTVEKTYRTSDFDIMFGTVEDIINLLDFDNFTTAFKSDDASSNLEFVSTIASIVTGAFSEVKNLLKEIFPEITDDELKRIKVKEVVPLILDVVKIAVNGLNTFGSKKN